MNYKSIIFYLGIFSLFISLFSILNILYSVYFDFNIDLSSYVITLFVSLFIGSLSVYIGFNYSKDITLNDQIVFILLSFILLPALIAIPYYFSIYNISILNSYFESVSGFTSIGFSIIENVKYIDQPLLLWRSSSQWIGGLFFILAIIGTIGSKQAKIKPAYLLTGGASGRNFYKNFNYNFIKISSIYFFSTLLIIFLYRMVDIRLFDAFNLAFTTISSGGFLTTDNLSNILENNLQILVISITFLLPILNFFLLFDIISNRIVSKNNYEDLHLLILIILLTILIYFFLVPEEGIFNVFFALTSAISTSGISVYSSNFDLSLLFILLTFVGGSLISTSSGFKYTRIYILLKISYQEICRLVKPNNIIDKNLYNSEVKIDDQTVKIAFLAFIFFIISLFILSSILTFENLIFEDSFKLAILTLTNTTASSLYGLENLTFFDLNGFTKTALIFFMIIGKVEIITVIYLFKRFVF